MTVDVDEVRAMLRELLSSPALPAYDDDPAVRVRMGKMIASAANEEKRTPDPGLRGRNGPHAW